MSLTNKLKAIGDAIRSKTGTTDTMTLDEMATAIESISTGGSSEDMTLKEFLEEDEKSKGFTNDDATYIGSYKFAWTYYTSLTFNNVTELASMSIYEPRVCTTLNLPNLEIANNQCVQNCYYLTTLNIPKVKTIGNLAFANCNRLVMDTIPASVETIGSQAFANGTALTSITFKGTPTSIASNSFSGCSKLTDIYVPWSEGAVANDPWGATNATIHYDTV